MAPPAFPDRRRPLADVCVLAVALLALLAWEASGLDLALIRMVGDAGGFAARDAWIARSLLHDAVRWISAACVVALACDVLRASQTGAPRAQKAYWLAIVLATLVAIPLLKRLTATSCPWDLAEFGGVAAYVPHWRFGITDGGPGHCFPAGHPVAAFAFVGLYYRWRASRPRLARLLLALVLCTGAMLGWAQMARGAHFASHTLWSAWLAAAMAVAARCVEPRWRAPEDAPRREELLPARVRVS